MSMFVKRFAGLALAAMVLHGCAGYGPIENKVKSDKDEIAALGASVEAMKKSGAVVRRAEAKLAGEEQIVKGEQRLPASFDKKFFYMSVPQPLPVILGEVGRRTGFPVRIQDGRSEAAAQQATMPGMMGAPGMPGMQQPVQQEMLSVDWQGNLKGLLDHLAMRTGMYWKLDAGYIYFFKTETRTFHVHLPQGKKDLKASVGLTGSPGSSSTGTTVGSTSGTGTSVTVDSNYSVDAFDALKQAVYSILGHSANQFPGMPGMPGAPGMPGLPGLPGLPPVNVAVNAALGTVTVTASPVQIERVEQYVRAINDRFAQNVLIDVKVYNVSVKRGVNAGASLMGAYQQSADRYRFTLSGNPNIQPTEGTPGTLVLDYTSVGSRWLGSQLTLQALQSIGDVSLRTSGQVLAANGQPTPLQVANEITYLASAATSIAPAGGPTTTTLTPGTKTVGLTANFLPMILGDNRILLQYQINLSSLLGIQQISSGGQLIQTPSVAMQSLQQQAYVRDGQTLVLFGFEQDRNGVDSAIGLGGGSKNAEANRSMMVIVMEVYSGK